MAALIRAAAAADFPAEVVLVISNRADAGGLEKASASHVPTLTIDSKGFGNDRAAFEAVLQSALQLLADGQIQVKGALCKTAGAPSAEQVLISPALAG